MMENFPKPTPLSQKGFIALFFILNVMSICLIFHCNWKFYNFFQSDVFNIGSITCFLKAPIYLHCHPAWTIDSWDSKNYWSSFPQQNPSRKVWLFWAAQDVPYTRFYMIDWTFREGERECVLCLENNPAPRMRRLVNQLYYPTK